VDPSPDWQALDTQQSCAFALPAKATAWRRGHLALISVFEAALGRSCLLAGRCQRDDPKKQFDDAVTSAHGDKASHRFQFSEFFTPCLWF
jgi:hypothetical protein